MEGTWEREKGKIFAFVFMTWDKFFSYLHIVSKRLQWEYSRYTDDGLFQLTYTKYLCSRNMATIESRWTHWKKLTNDMQLCIQ